MHFSAVVLSLLAALAGHSHGSPFSEIHKRSTTCGGTHYSTAQVNASANAACSHVRAGTQAGGSTYPHRYNNYEGFDFPVKGPYNTFPMRTNGVYNGGAPGPDRVIITDDCRMAGQITHTGASGNGFLGCSGTN